MSQIFRMQRNLKHFIFCYFFAVFTGKLLKALYYLNKVANYLFVLHIKLEKT